MPRFTSANVFASHLMLRRILAQATRGSYQSHLQSPKAYTPRQQAVLTASQGFYRLEGQGPKWKLTVDEDEAEGGLEDKEEDNHVVGEEVEAVAVARAVVKARRGARNGLDKRARNTENQDNAKRRKIEGKDEDLPVYATKFSQEEIESEARKPKRKVAVLIGYSGSGYKGMQLNHTEKTIEGDLFTAFVAAGAISKANADDPKKSSLVRCARTDKGVHAAGNVISLKLIIEDAHIVSKINEKLNPQIRVWGIEQTNGAFSAYQLCDSRIYEYLIPTHCFVPPHPQSFLGKKIAELAEEANDLEGHQSRQIDAATFWAETEDRYIIPIMGTSEPELAERILAAFYETNAPPIEEDPIILKKLNHYATSVILNPANNIDQKKLLSASDAKHRSFSEERILDAHSTAPVHEVSPLEVLTHHLKTLHQAAKKAYRISPLRLARIRSILSRYVGSHRFHNYTIDKTIRDPSATRVIKSFTVGDNPIIINDTEWLSLKVHGQSFMMHQIRKMVSMAALLVRCGCHEGRIQDSYVTERLSIPKAPSLGLLLERPVFDEYNKKLEEFGRAKIDFGRYEMELEEFKQREIYERIFREEEKDNPFQAFFAGLDGARSAQLLYLSSVGVTAVERDVGRGPTGLGVERMQGAGDGGEDEEEDSMRKEADRVMEAELKEEWDGKAEGTTATGEEQRETKPEDVNDIASEDEKGGHDEG